MLVEVSISMTVEDVAAYRKDHGTKQKWLDYARKSGREHDANVVMLKGPDGVVGTVKLRSEKKSKRARRKILTIRSFCAIFRKS